MGGTNVQAIGSMTDATGAAGRRRMTVAGSAAILVAASLVAMQPVQAAPISFGTSVLAGESSTRPTVIQFGPDGRLYVAQQDGAIKAYTVVRNAANNYSVTSTETINLVKTIVNHDDDGTVSTVPAVIGVRQLTGMLVTGSAADPVIYAASSDPRYGGGGRGDLNLDTNSGTVSRLTKTGTGWTKVDLVRGLPRSEENHAVNGLALDAGTNMLYLAIGGNTNMGAPSRVFAYLPETALSAAILSIDLTAIGGTTYDLPTLDDPTVNNSIEASREPFGGNDGLNQARLVAGGPVQVYSPGYRNPYDVIITSRGQMFTWDNGYNAGQGGIPVSAGTPNCTNDVVETSVTGFDSLHRVTGLGYYGGHPNPTRGNRDNTFGGQSPVPTAHPIECEFRPYPARGQLANDPSSTNGLVEYTASNFGGALRGDLLSASYDNYVLRTNLDAAGTSSLATTTLFGAVGIHPLDITTTPDTGPFPGTVWVVDVGDDKVHVYEPSDYSGTPPTCTGGYNSTDEDADGFTNADEVDNATDPCSAGDRPHDWDADFVSDLNDGDDDNDGRPDTSDPFAIDPADGLTRELPQVYTFDDATVAPGGLLNLGFTGLMTAGDADYATLYDRTKLTAGGAPGVLTVDDVGPGSALGGANSQAYGFQLGVHVTPQTGPFTIQTRMVSPFAGGASGAQSLGIQMGTGTQDDYLSLVLAANGGSPRLEVVREVAGTPTTSVGPSLDTSGLQTLDLFLDVDPVSATVTPAFGATTGAGTIARTSFAGPIALPSTWLSGVRGLAAGVIGTNDGQILPASWDLLSVTKQGARQPDATIKTPGTSTALGTDVYNLTGASQTKSTWPAAGTSKTYIVRVFNDGSVPDTFAILGAGATTGFSVRYLKGASGTTDISSSVLAGTYRMPTLAPGSSAVVRLVVTVAGGVGVGTTRTWAVRSTSVGDPTKADVVVARVKVT